MSDVDWVGPYVLTKEKVDAFWCEYNAEIAAWQEVIERMKVRDALVKPSSAFPSISPTTPREP